MRCGLRSLRSRLGSAEDWKGEDWKGEDWKGEDWKGENWKGEDWKEEDWKEVDWKDWKEEDLSEEAWVSNMLQHQIRWCQSFLVKLTFFSRRRLLRLPRLLSRRPRLVRWGRRLQRRCVRGGGAGGGGSQRKRKPRGGVAKLASGRCLSAPVSSRRPTAIQLIFHVNVFLHVKVNSMLPSK